MFPCFHPQIGIVGVRMGQQSWALSGLYEAGRSLWAQSRAPLGTVSAEKSLPSTSAPCSGGMFSLFL